MQDKPIEKPVAFLAGCRLFGFLLAILGLTEHFEITHWIPPAWQFEQYPGALILVGYLFTLPYTLTMVKGALARRHG